MALHAGRPGVMSEKILTSGQRPCVWFIVAIMLVMMKMEFSSCGQRGKSPVMVLSEQSSRVKESWSFQLMPFILSHAHRNREETGNGLERWHSRLSTC